MKKRTHYWLVVSKLTGLSVSNTVHYSRREATQYWRMYPSDKKNRQVIKVAPVDEIVTGMIVTRYDNGHKQCECAMVKGSDGKWTVENRL